MLKMRTTYRMDDVTSLSDLTSVFNACDWLSARPESDQYNLQNVSWTAL